MATDEESNNPDTVRRGDVAPAFTIRLLGTFELCQAGQPLAPPRFRKSQSVLALLAIRRGCEVERDWLAGLLWPAASQPAALHNLRNSLADLRRALGPEAARLRSPTFRTLALDLNGAFVDVLAFDAALARGDPPGLEEAIALYQGPLLEGCAEDWAFQERQAREQAYFAARETLAAHSLARGDLADAEHHLRAVVATDPLRESAQRTLMELLAAGGNVAAALLAYRELRVRLHRDLNAEPDPETRALFERIRAEAAERANARRPTSDAHKALDEAASAAVPARLSGGGRRTSAVPRGRAPRRKSPGHAWGPAASAPIGDAHAASPAGPEETAAWPPDHLPRRLTRFFGREAEIERLGAMLQACGTALVTLTGPGGSGKTRLALETARRLQAAVAREAAPSCSSLYGQSPPECWFVPLLDLADPGLIADKIGDEMRLPRRPHEEPLERIVAFLSEHDPLRRRLLVLDNFEHLVEGGAEVVRTLLERVAGLTILVTSRRRLDLPGEREFPLTPLPVPRDEGRGMRDEIRGEERGMRDENRSGLLSSLIPHPFSLAPASPSSSTGHRRCAPTSR